MRWAQSSKLAVRVRFEFAPATRWSLGGWAGLGMPLLKHLPLRARRYSPAWRVKDWTLEGISRRIFRQVVYQRSW